MAGQPKRYWEIQARVAIDWVGDAAADARAAGVPWASDDELERAHTDVTAHLRLAREFLDKHPTPRTWWLGTRVEGAWAHIHAAKVRLIDLLGPDRLAPYSPRVLSLVQLYLKPTDSERVAVKWWFDQLDHQPTPVVVTGSLGAPSALVGSIVFEGSIATSPSSQPDGRKAAALATALQASYERIAAQYQRLRRFQFSLIGSAAAVLLAVGALLLIGWT